MRKTFYTIVATASLCLLLNTSLISVKVPDEVPFRPNSDFSFIRRFHCVSDLFGKEQWHSNKGRSFDKDGVHLTNDKKHPVNACHYALFCYDEFTTTSDSSYYFSFLNQVRYLMDTSSYNLVEHDKAAYPYNIVFHDLKPPWYSALAQSEAISVLIRYYALTRDPKALPLIVKLRNFMVNTQSSGCGTMNITPEGNEWYEEYPNSKQEKQVLNGFLLAIVALYEYSNLFPDDTVSRRLYENSIKTIKASFQFYDTGSWLKYNRGDGRLVNNGYMKWQILEARLLYAITGDIYFKHLMMLISSYVFDKPYETPGSKLQDYDFSVPLTIGVNEMLEFKGKAKLIPITSANATITSSYNVNNANINKIIDNNQNTYSIFTHVDSLHKGDHFISVDLKAKRLVGACKISYTDLDSVAKPGWTFGYKDSAGQKKWKKISIVSKTSDPQIDTYFLEPKEYKVIGLFFDDVEKFKEFHISNLVFQQPVQFSNSQFQHYITPVYESVSGNVKLSMDLKGMKGVAIFHKSSNDSKTLDKEKWDPLKAYTKVPVELKSTGKKYHRFLVVCEPSQPSASIGKVRFQQ